MNIHLRNVRAMLRRIHHLVQRTTWWFYDLAKCWGKEIFRNKKCLTPKFPPHTPLSFTCQNRALKWMNTWKYITPSPLWRVRLFWTLNGSLLRAHLLLRNFSQQQANVVILRITYGCCYTLSTLDRWREYKVELWKLPLTLCSDFSGPFCVLLNSQNFLQPVLNKQISFW